jgi:3-phenylpropionate/trans-cinnamate dioxygenase ferredoxin reductase subunit
MTTVVIAGAGHAAGQAVASLKQQKFGGCIVMIGDEPYLPYQRPPLSKKFLAGEMPAERLYFKPESFYADDNIEVRINTRVESIDRDTVPVAGGNLDGVLYLRNIADVDNIRAAIAPGKHIVIVGAGYIGLEVAAVCRQLELEVTVIEMEDRVMSRVVSPQVSDFYQRQHLSHGVDLRLSTGLEAFQGNDHIAAVATTDGQSIPADLVVVGVGILPNTELAEAAGLAVDNGIVVDDRCQTEDADIYAIGDCTSHPNSIYGRQLRLESVHNALEQAKTAASNVCGVEAHYSQVPWFWSDQYDIKLQIAGLSEGYDQTVLRGDPSSAGFACFYLKNHKLIAVDAINSPREFMQSKALIANHAVIDPQRLADENVLLKDLG